MLLALLTSTVFAATTKIPAGKVEIASPVEVPLYAGLAADDPYVYVEAKSGESTLFLRVSTGGSAVILTQGAADGLKLKADKKTSAASLKSLDIGGAKASNLTVYVGALTDGDAAPYGVDGEIGIGAFPELSWAVLRSTGKLRIGPASAGAGWVSELGTSLPYTSGKAEMVKIGKEKYERESAPIIVNLPWDGVVIPTGLASASDSLILGEADQKQRWWSVKGMELPAYDLPKAASFQDGEGRFESRSATIGTITEALTVSRATKGFAYAVSVPAHLGVDALQHYDIAVDSAGKTVGLKVLNTAALADYGATYEANLRKALEPAPAKDGAAPDAEAAKNAKAGAIAPLADWLVRNGKVEEALALSKERAELLPDDCTTWQDYGETALAAARPTEAAPAFQKAADLYAPWAAKGLAVRTQLKKDYDAAKKSKGAYDDVIPQSHACFTAWSGLARAHIASGHPEKVAELYPAKLDLDDGLATAAGIAALVKGDAAAAEAAFRQAIFLDPQDSAVARNGLFLALSNRALANAQLERGGAVADSPVTLSVYAEAIRKLEGGAKAIDAVKALAESRSNNPFVLLELGRQYQKDGNADAATAQLRKAHVLLLGSGAATSKNTTLRAAWALLQLGEGQADAAKATADALTSAAPNEAEGWWVASVIAEAGGDTARAAELLRKAGAVGTNDPLFAVAAAK